MLIKKIQQIMLILLGFLLICNNPLIFATQSSWKAAEIVSACAIAPAAITAQFTADYGTEQAKIRMATIASLARLTHSAISSYNHRNDGATNKYNLFGLCVNGFNFVHNAYKLSTLKNKELSEEEQQELAQRKADWSYVSLAGTVALGVAESGLALNLAMGGSMPLSKVTQKGESYCLGLSSEYGKFPALSSGLLSMLRCYNNYGDATNPKVKLAWVGAALGNTWLLRTEYKNWLHFDEKLAKKVINVSDIPAIKEVLEKETESVWKKDSLAWYNRK